MLNAIGEYVTGLEAGPKWYDSNIDVCVCLSVCQSVRLSVCCLRSARIVGRAGIEIVRQKGKDTVRLC